MKNISPLLALVFLPFILFAQGFELLIGNDQDEFIYNIIPTQDNGLLVLGAYPSQEDYSPLQAKVFKISSTGQLAWSQELGQPQWANVVTAARTAEDSLLHIFTQSNYATATSFTLNTNGLTATTIPYTGFQSGNFKVNQVANLSGGRYIVAGYTTSAAFYRVINSVGGQTESYGTVDAGSNPSITQEISIGYNQERILSYQLGYQAIVNNDAIDVTHPLLIFTDSLGNFIQEIKFFNKFGSFQSTVVNNQGAYLSLFNHDEDLDLFYIASQTDTMTLASWEGESGFKIIPSDDGNLFIVTKRNTDNKLILRKINTTGLSLWEKTFNYVIEDIPYVTQTNDGQIAVVFLDQNQPENANQTRILKIDQLGNTFANTIIGSVYEDLDNDCMIDNNDSTLSGWKITATGNGHASFAWSDNNGNYQMPVDTGTYELAFTPNGSNGFGICQIAQPVNFQNYYDTLLSNHLFTDNCEDLVIDKKILNTCGPGKASIDLEVSGNSSPVEFLWSNGANSSSISELNQGIYSVIIDQGGCQTYDTTIIKNELSAPWIWTKNYGSLGY